MAERHDGIGVQRRVDTALGLGGIDHLCQPATALGHARPHDGVYLWFVTGRGERLQQHPLEGFLALGLVAIHQVTSRHQEDVFHPPLKPVVGEQGIELIAGGVFECRGEQISLAPVSRVDRPGGYPGPASDLGHPCSAVAPGRELGGRGRQQPLSKRVVAGYWLGTDAGRGRGRWC